MIVTYRLKSTDGHIPDERRSRNEGKIKFVRKPTDKARGPIYAGESDWMVPNLRDPYVQAG